MGCVRRGKKQKQGPKTLTKEQAVGRERERFETRTNTEKLIDSVLYRGKMGQIALTTATMLGR